MRGAARRSSPLDHLKTDGDVPLPFAHLLELAIEQAHDGIAIMRFTGNADVPVRIVYANAAIERLSGLSKRELLEPSNPFLRVQAQNRARYDELFARVRAGESVLFEIELGSSDLSTLCEVRWTPLQIAGESVDHYVAVIRDLTERSR